MPFSIEQVVEVLETRGSAMYGREAVTQLEHARQCAWLAAQDGASNSLIAASLLHDLGHLLAKGSRTSSDDLHQYLALPFLRGTFPDAVLQPMQLHVDAKRYLCWLEPGYFDSLSAASKRSLELQGGAFNAAGAERFIQVRFAREAVRLRRYDDLAKDPYASPPPLHHFVPMLAAARTPSVIEA